MILKNENEIDLTKTLLISETDKMGNVMLGEVLFGQLDKSAITLQGCLPFWGRLTP